MSEEKTKSTIQIPSCPDYFITRGGDVYNKKGKKLSPYINNGYCFIGLYNNKRERKNFCVHRLVYEAWGGKLLYFNFKHHSLIIDIRKDWISDMTNGAIKMTPHGVIKTTPPAESESGN